MTLVSTEPKSIKLWTTNIKKVYLGSTQVRPPSNMPTANMLAYYPLVSDANDHKADLWVSGTTYNWSWYWTASYTTVGGKTSAHFSYRSNSIDTGVTLWTLPVTLCAWSYFTSLDDWHCLIWNANGNNNDCYAIRWYNWWNNSYRPLLCNWTSSDLSLPNNLFVPNTWQFIAYTIDSSATKFYVDGTLSYTWWAWWPASWYTWFWIASFWSYHNHWWDGNIRDVAIYNRVLTQDEITAYYSETQ